MKKQDLLICIREDCYCIDTLVMINHPKINDIVEVEQIVRDQDGTWLCLKGYDVDMFDASCFRKATLSDINLYIEAKIKSTLCEI